MSNIIKDVFKDYKEENSIINAKIENIDLFKKSKKLEIKLKVEQAVKISDISSFEDYLKNRFQIQQVIINIENEKRGAKPLFTMQEDWEKIVEYLSKNFPLCKAILNESKLEIEENIVFIVLKTKSADFLHFHNIDKEIEHIILNLYGINCKVEYKENVTDDIIKEQEEYLNSLEKIACDDLINEINTQNEIANKMEESKKKSIEEQENTTDKHSLILGRTEKIKDKIIKITDLTTDYGRVAIEGKVINVDSRELKNGKTLAQFNIYDGTSTITCKSFIEQNKVEEVMRKTKISKKT